MGAGLGRGRPAVPRSVALAARLRGDLGHGVGLVEDDVVELLGEQLIRVAQQQQRMGRVCAMMGDKEGQLGWLKKAFDVDRKNAEVAAELAQLDAADRMDQVSLAIAGLLLFQALALLAYRVIESRRDSRS